MKRGGVNRAKLEYWQKHILQWERSDLSQAGYCREHRLSECSFGEWRRKLKAELNGNMPQSSSQPQFVELSRSSTSAATMKIERGEFTIHVPANFEASELRRLLEVLEC